MRFFGLFHFCMVKRSIQNSFVQCTIKWNHLSNCEEYLRLESCITDSPDLEQPKRSSSRVDYFASVNISSSCKQPWTFKLLTRVYKLLTTCMELALITVFSFIPSVSRKQLSKRENVKRQKESEGSSSLLKEWRQQFRGPCRGPWHIPRKGQKYKMCPK